MIRPGGRLCGTTQRGRTNLSGQSFQLEPCELLPDPRLPLQIRIRTKRERVEVSVVSTEIHPQAFRDVEEPAGGKLPQQLVVLVIGQGILASRRRPLRVEVGIGEVQVARAQGVERLPVALSGTCETFQKEAFGLRCRHRKTERAKGAASCASTE